MRQWRGNTNGSSRPEQPRRDEGLAQPRPLRVGASVLLAAEAAYFVGHIYETSSLTQGPDAWAAMLELTQTPMGHLILLLVIGMSAYHSANGIRLIFTHGGKGLGKPGRPDYPYDAVSLNYRQKSGIWIALILAATAMLYGASVLFGGE